MTETVFFYGLVVFAWINNKHTSLVLLKIQQFDISCKRTISKNLVDLSLKNGSDIKSQENETSVEEAIPFLYIWRSVILKYLEFSGIENVGKNVYPEKKNADLFWINYSNLWKIHILLKKSINPFNANFSLLCPLKTIRISGGAESSESNCRKRRRIILAYKNRPKQ